MKKKNKKKIENDGEKKKEKTGLNLHHNTKRGIAIIVLFLLAILFLFGFFNAGGSMGKFLNKVGGIIFGLGKWLFPIVLLISAGILLFKKRTAFYVAKILGLSIIFISFLGLIHIFYETNTLLEIAKNGQGGGIVGYIVAIAFIKLTGKAAGIIILLALMAIGAMVAFNFSVVEFFARFLDKDKYANSFDKIIDKKNKVLITKKENANLKKERVIEKEQTKEKKKNLKNNIKEIKFVGNTNENIIKNSTIDEKNKEVDVVRKKNGQTFISRKNAKVSFDINDKQSLSAWKLPPLNLLTSFNGKAKAGNINENTKIIEDTFRNFGIDVEFEEAKVGPTVTQYSFRPAVGIKLSRIVALGDDLALALAAHPIRIEAPIPGKSLVGVEVPNSNRVDVGLRDVLENYNFQESESPLAFPLGKNVEGDVVMAYLEKMPHLLVAGSTNTGKSVCINSLIVSLLYKNSPEDLKMIMVDPKRVELTPYNGIPHLLSDVVVNGSKVVNALKWAIDEMEKRYKLFQEVGVRNIVFYQEKLKKGAKRKYVDEDTGEVVEEDLAKVPYIVIIIDELSDLMASHGKEIEGAIVRLAQKARAVGIHLVVSTQRPSVEVITGLIKANISARIALQVNSQVNSRTILDMRGAENLLGKGDLLFLSPDNPKPKRLQGAFISDAEIKRVVDFIKKQARETKQQQDNDRGEKNDNKVADITAPKKASENNDNNERLDFGNMKFKDDKGGDEKDDAIYEEAKKMVVEMNKASASLLQRRLRIGFNRAARLIEMLEEEGVIGEAQGSKPREVLITSDGDGANADKIDYKKEDVDQEQRDKWQI